MITVKKVFKHKKQQVYEIEMANEAISIKVLTLGATLTHFSQLNKPNTLVSYKDVKSYTQNEVYLGSTIGPLAGRTKGGRFEMDDQQYQLDLNEPLHHLHGGENGLDKQVFDYVYEDDDRFPSLVFSGMTDYTSQGYPGQITSYITYRLVRNTLIINLKAIPSTKMPLNLTTHAYFNLSHEATVVNHLLKIDSNQVLKLDDTLANTAERISVQNTAFDFRSAYTIGQRIKRSHEQFELTRSLDHCYLLRDSHSIVLFDPVSKQSLAINTTAPAVVIYLANYFDERFESEYHSPAQNQSGIAIEPSDVPNGINLSLADFYSPTKPFDQTTWYTLN